MSSDGFSKFAYLKALSGHRFPKGDGAFRVLVALLNYADGATGKNAHPGITQLAADCVMGESTVRRHLKWLKANGYVVQESRGHYVGDVNLASVYSFPDLPPVAERKLEVPTAQLEPPTAHLEQTYRSFEADLPLTCERLSDHVPDHGSDQQPSETPVPPLSMPNMLQDNDSASPQWDTPSAQSCTITNCSDPAEPGSTLCTECALDLAMAGT